MRKGQPHRWSCDGKQDKKLLNPQKRFKKTVGLAGIAPFRFHDQRHTFATRLVRAGVDKIGVQHLLGLSKFTTPARYAHSLAGDKITAVHKLDLGGVCSLPDFYRKSFRGRYRVRGK
jgi:integrase